MKPDRRQFLAGAGALAATACDPAAAPPTDPQPAPDRAPEPAPWVPSESLDPAAFPGGVQVGDAGVDAAIVSVRTDEPLLELVVMAADGDGWVEVVRESDLAAADGGLQREIGGLEADTAYTVVFLVGDRRSATARFRTAFTDPGLRKVVFAATSCLGSGNPTWENLSRIAAFDPDFTLLLGDTVYADGAVTQADYRAEWAAAYANPNLQALFARSGVIATWDDHEVANNWRIGDGDALHAGVTADQVDIALAAFREAMPMREGPGGSGLWRSIAWGPVEVFVLDSRGERGDGRIVSEEQLAWIGEALRASGAVFKLVLASVHVTDHAELMSTGAADDRWQGYPAQRDALVAAIAEVPGTFVITGDMHYGGIQRIDPEGGPAADKWEIAAGPAGSSLFPFDAVAQIGGGVPAQYDVVLESWSSCVFVADPGLGTLTVQFIGDDGAILAERVLAV
jgi:phosphodiesterase/alkaline phosphatase D-like protein